MAQYGEQHHGSKLIAAEVRAIRRRHPGEPIRALARAYGVSRTCIWKVVSGVTWRHIA